MNALQKVNDWCEYGDNRAYILMMFARRKYNGELTNNTEIIRRRVITDEDEAEEAVFELAAIAQEYDYNFRLYCTVNARDMKAAYYRHVERLVGMAQNVGRATDGIDNWLKAVDSEWKSTLHNPTVAADEYFHFDIDVSPWATTEEFIHSLPTQEGRASPGLDASVYKTHFETPNGYHVITDPFNYTEWESPVEYDEMDTDGMFHVASL